MTIQNKQDVVEALIREFHEECAPLEKPKQLLHLVDERIDAHFCECHLVGSVICRSGMTGAPMDPDEQPEYKANRDIDEDSAAFQKMKDDARLRRSFSNLIAEWRKDADSDEPLKIIGGQHRFEAIRLALGHGVDVYHGVKVYFALDLQQRVDVQLISNTNIDISGDFIDRVLETGKGSELRTWCQTVGLLEKDTQFTDSYVRRGPISVRMARTFITNYFLGTGFDTKDFGNRATTPMLYKPGSGTEEWEKTKSEHPDLWNDAGLMTAGREFAALIKAQRDAFSSPKGKGKHPSDYPEKALNLAIIGAWAFVAGVLQKNHERLKRHFDLKNWSAHDPLNAAALATAKHAPTDPENYRGLGSRTDPQERGRFAELFFMQAEEGKGINKKWVDSAIKQYHAKDSQLAASAARAKARGAS